MFFSTLFDVYILKRGIIFLKLLYSSLYIKKKSMDAPIILLPFKFSQILLAKYIK
jgi:hypothetical protein